MINSLTSDHSSFMGKLKKRRQILTELHKSWQNAELGKCFQQIGDARDPILTFEVAQASFGANKHITFLNYELIAKLVPLLQDLIGQKLEMHILVGLKSMFNILQHFYQQIVQLKTTRVS